MKKNYILAAVTVLIWATCATSVKIMLNGMPNMETLSVSSGIGFLFLLTINLCTNTRRKFSRYSLKNYLQMAGLGAGGLFLYSALYYFGLSELTAQTACIVNYLWPMMLVLFACIILKERMTLIKAAALLISFSGIVVLTMGDETGISGNYMAGIISCIVAAAAYGLYSVLNKKMDFNQNIFMMVSWGTVSVCAFVFGVLTEEWIPIEGVQWLGILWLGIVVDALAYLFWALAIRGADEAAKIANLAYLVPVLSVILSAILLDEAVTVYTVIALVLVIGGILLQSLFDKKAGERK